MRTILAVLLVAALMVCPVVFASGCQQCGCSHTAVAPTYRDQNPNDNAKEISNENGGEWYGSEAGSSWE